MSPTPIHATISIGQSVDPTYFSPGYTVMHGRAIGSPWVIAYWASKAIRFERAAIGQPWVRVS